MKKTTTRRPSRLRAKIIAELAEEKKSQLPEGYSLSADEVFLPLAETDVVPDFYFAGPTPPSDVEIHAIANRPLLSESDTNIYWYNSSLNLLMVVDWDMLKDGQLMPFVPEDSGNVPKYVVDAETTRVIGKIVAKSDVHAVAPPKISLQEIVARSKSGQSLNEIFSEEED